MCADHVPSVFRPRIQSQCTWVCWVAHTGCVALTLQALSFCSTSVKALFRRAQARRFKDDFEAAAADLATARGIEPTNSALRGEQDALNVRPSSPSICDV